MGKISKKIALRYPKHLVNKPVIYHLIKDYNLELNILKATINSEEGHMVVELSGDKADYHNGIEYILHSGLLIDAFRHEIERQESKCTDCGACVTFCPASAFSVDIISRRIEFDENKCIVCGLCVLSCPSRSMEMHF